jgi:hypothetical protein
MPALRSVVFVVGAEIRVCHVRWPYSAEEKDSGGVVFVYVVGIIIGVEFGGGGGLDGGDMMEGVFFSLFSSWRGFD